MLPLLFLMIMGVSCCVGALLFAVCVVIPRTRSQALSAAAWWVAAGLGLCLWLAVWVFVALVFGVGAEVLLPHSWHLGAIAQKASTVLAAAFLGGGVLFVLLFASVLAWLHQWIAARMTFQLFRLWATLVLSGIGCIYGAVFGEILFQSRPGLSFLPVTLLVLCGTVLASAGCGSFGWRHAASLRGNWSGRWNWIEQQEFRRQA